jgi:hypothetical protein
LALLLFASAVAANDDHHRTACTTTGCLRIKDFVKAHYCAIPTDANYPDDSCRPRRDRAGKLTVEAEYDCTSVANGKRCLQSGRPPQAQRDIALATTSSGWWTALAR